MSAPMVLATLRDKDPKTQTRRIVKPQPPRSLFHLECLPSGEWRDEEVSLGKCPYGSPGTRLWVRETWKYAGWSDDGEPWILYRSDGVQRLIDDADEDLSETWAGLSDPENYKIDGKAADRRWRPSIFMPRWASRITLEIESVRVERLNDITPEDAAAEGLRYIDEGPGAGWWVVDGTSVCGDGSVEAYEQLWELINGRDSWADNPWVWAITFRRLPA